MQLVIQLFNHYGYVVLFVALMLELIAFPLPGEVLMIYCGVLINEGKMNWTLSVLVALAGVTLGITLSYFIGKILGRTFFEKHGHYVHMDKNRLDKISLWFNKYGNKLSIVSYFIPGVRHITGYFLGITKVAFKAFAISSYLGALIWTVTFISLGKILGSNWETYHHLIKKYLVIGSLCIALIMIIIYIYKKNKSQIYEFTIKMLNNGIKIFHSLGRIKVVIAGISILFLVLSSLVIGIVQDYLAHEFNEFDEVVQYLVAHIFEQNWKNTMELFKILSNTKSFIVILIIIAIWILIKGRDKAHEIKFLIILSIGGDILNNLLRLIFKRTGPSGILYIFPSRECFMAVTVFGFLSYIMIRHLEKIWIGWIIATLSLIICVFIGLSMIYFEIQYPSDVIAGYEFGGVWITLNIILLEIYRVLSKSILLLPKYN